MSSEEMNRDAMSEEGGDLPETDTQRAVRELAEAREKHALAYLSAQDAAGDPEEAALLRDNLHAATQDGKRAYRGYVKAATDGLVAQIDGTNPSNEES